jgi:hypothetical protein
LLRNYSIKSKENELRVSQNSTGVETTEQLSLQKQSNPNYFSRLKLEVQEQKLIQSLKTFLQEEAAKDELGYNLKTIEIQ